MIRLRSLELENFLSHRKTALQFDDEAYVILGENASGKTSILRGIFFALFGKDFSVSTVERLVNREATRFRVELSFQKGNDLFTVRRNYSALSRRGGAELLKNGKLYASGVRQVQKVIGEELSLDPFVFRRTVYIPQGEIVEFLNQQRKEKRQILNRLLELEEIVQKFEAIKQFYRKFSNVAELLESRLTEYQNTRKKLQSLVEEIADKKEKLHSLRTSLREEEKLLKNQEELYRDFIKKREIYKQLVARLKEKEGEVGKLQETLIRYQKLISGIEKQKGRLPELKSSIEILPQVKQIKELLDKLIEIKGKIAELEKEKLEIKQVKDRILSLEKELPGIIEEIEVKKKELVLLKEKLSELTKNLVAAQKKLQRFNSLKATYVTLQDRLNFLASEIASVSSSSEKVFLLERRKDSLFEELKELEKKAVSARAKLRELSDRLKVLNQERSQTCPICGSFLSEEKRDKIARDIKEKLFKAKEEEKKLLEELEKKRSALKVLEENLKTACSELRHLNRVKEEKKTVENRIKELLEEIGSLKGVEEEFCRLNEEKEVVEKEIASVETLIKFLTEKKRNLENELESWKRKYSPHREKLIEDSISKLTDEAEHTKARAAFIRDNLGIDVRTVPEVTKLLKELEEKRREVAEIEGELKNLPFYTREFQRVKESLQQCREQVSRLKEEMERIGFSEELFSSVRESYEFQKKRIENLRSEANRIEGELKAMEKTEQELQKEMIREKAAVDILTKLLDVKRVIESVLTGFHPEKGFLKDVRKYLLPQIAVHCREFFEEFSFEAGDIEISEDLTVTFGSSGGGAQLEEFSGGQQIAFALSLRFAMARYFSQNFELLMLDEPTIHLDQVRRQALTDLLLKLKTRIPQMLVVTHDSELEVVGDRVIRVSSEKGFSEVHVE